MHFVFELGDSPDQPLMIGEREVADLFRLSDLVFMPSHREGFGMSVLEAGLLGIPVISTAIPAAVEIGGPEVTIFPATQPPAELATQILAWADQHPQHKLRRRVRQNYTWSAIFQHDIAPLFALF